jgi:hypothetical protein
MGVPKQEVEKLKNTIEQKEKLIRDLEKKTKDYEGNIN